MGHRNVVDVFDAECFSSQRLRANTPKGVISGRRFSKLCFGSIINFGDFGFGNFIEEQLGAWVELVPQEVVCFQFPLTTPIM